MAHFAEIDSNNIVLRVIVIDDKNLLDANNVEKEENGIDYCKSLFGEDTKWIQTSYNNKIRGHYAGVGDIYDSNNDVFIPQTRGEIIDAKELLESIESENKS